MHSSNFDELVTWGVQIMSTSILAIIITAPVGLFLIQFLGPYLLSKDSQKTEPNILKSPIQKGSGFFYARLVLQHSTPTGGDHG